MSSVPSNPTALVSAYRFYQYINAYPVSALATQFTHALSIATTAETRAAADAELSAFFQASGSFAEVTPASFGMVTEYLYRFAPAWAKFADGFTYTLAFGNSHSPNSPAVPGGTVSFTKNSTPASAPNDGNRGYTITYTAPDGTQTPLTFFFGQLVSEVKTATPAICLQTNFMPLGLFTGNLADTQTIVPSLYGSVNGQQSVGLNENDSSQSSSGIQQFFDKNWPYVVVGGLVIVGLGVYVCTSPTNENEEDGLAADRLNAGEDMLSFLVPNLKTGMRRVRIKTVKERRARDYKDGLLKKKFDAIQEEENEGDDSLIEQQIKEMNGSIDKGKLESLPNEENVAALKAKLDDFDGEDQIFSAYLEQVQKLQAAIATDAETLVNQQAINAEETELEEQEQLLQNLAGLGVNPALEEAAEETGQNYAALQLVEPNSPDANQSLTQVQQNIVQTQTSLDAQTQANDGSFSAQAQQQNADAQQQFDQSEKEVDVAEKANEKGEAADGDDDSDEEVES